MMIDRLGIYVTPPDGPLRVVPLNVGLYMYIDVSFADRPSIRASTGAYIVTAAGLPLIWKTKK